jgi:hypothetical protein
MQLGWATMHGWDALAIYLEMMKTAWLVVMSYVEA